MSPRFGFTSKAGATGVTSGGGIVVCTRTYKKKLKGSVRKIGFKDPEKIEVEITLGSSVAVFIPVSIGFWADTLSLSFSGMTVF